TVSDLVEHPHRGGACGTREHLGATTVAVLVGEPVPALNREIGGTVAGRPVSSHEGEIGEIRLISRAVATVRATCQAQSLAIQTVAIARREGDRRRSSILCVGMIAPADRAQASERPPYPNEADTGLTVVDERDVGLDSPWSVRGKNWNR